MNWASESRPVVIGLGELLWDVFPDGRRPGGAPANVAFHASQLGCEGVVVSRVGQDGLGEELLAYLAQQGISTRWIQRDQQHPTGTVTVQLNRNGQPQYTIHENVAWDYLEMEEGLKELMQTAAAVCFGTLAQRSHTSRRTIHQALAAAPKECLIVYDVNLRRPFVRRDWVEESLVLAHIVKLTLEELHELADLLAIGLS
ncbi:MAG TPA: PfkB family carbohydrate kinase, partial [Thermoguttaceae bacterium]|nr:PfkB family carbohydrate kinase [Thermoguttaceae bacterium]